MFLLHASKKVNAWLRVFLAIPNLHIFDRFSVSLKGTVNFVAQTDSSHITVILEL